MPAQIPSLSSVEYMQMARQEYGIPVDHIQPLSIGTANCFCLHSDSKRFFLKEFPSWHSLSAIETEAQVLSLLKENGFPTAAILPSLSGAICLQKKGHYSLLQEWIDGKTYSDQPMPHSLLLESAELLAQIHTILRSMALPVEMDERWVQRFEPQKAAEQYALLRASVPNEDPLAEKIRQDLADKERYCEEAPSPDLTGVTFSPTHGDFSALQCICDENRIRAVIDFSSAKTLPIVWEVMRSFMQSGPACQDAFAFRAEDLAEYVQAYMRFAPLSSADLRQMPLLYLHQLVRSRFGYKEYLQGNSRSASSLLRFAFWRTDVCRVLLPQIKAISAYLESLI